VKRLDLRHITDKSNTVMVPVWKYIITNNVRNKVVKTLLWSCVSVAWFTRHINWLNYWFMTHMNRKNNVNLQMKSVINRINGMWLCLSDFQLTVSWWSSTSIRYKDLDIWRINYEALIWHLDWLTFEEVHIMQFWGNRISMCLVSWNIISVKLKKSN